MNVAALDGKCLRAILRVLACPEIWTLPPRVHLSLLRSLRSIRPASAETGTIPYVNCPPVGSLAFRRHLRGLKEIGKGRSVPLVVHLVVTDRCGYHCARCSNRRMGTAPGPDPSLNMLRTLLDELKQAGTVSVAFTGGEPLLREDLPELVKACGPEMSSLLFTSGQGLTSAMARELRSAGLVMAAVSLDHRDEGEHDRIRGQPGAFRQAVEAIGHFLETGIYTAAQAVVEHRLLSAEGELEAFIAFCARLGVHDVILLEPMTVAGSRIGTELAPEARMRLVDLHLRSARDPARPKVTAASYLEGPAFLGCQAGFTFFYVNSRGDLCPCDFVPLSLGNVFRLGLDPVLERARRLIARPCTTCLARRLAAVPAGDGSPRAEDERPEEVLARLPPDGLPQLMRQLLPRDGRGRQLLRCPPQEKP